jgi:hypothetical protein
LTNPKKCGKIYPHFVPACGYDGMSGDIFLVICVGFIMFGVMEIKKGEEGFRYGLSGLDIKSLKDTAFIISRKLMVKKMRDERDREVHLNYKENEDIIEGV